MIRSLASQLKQSIDIRTYPEPEDPIGTIMGRTETQDLKDIIDYLHYCINELIKALPPDYEYSDEWANMKLIELMAGSYLQQELFIAHDLLAQFAVSECEFGSGRALIGIVESAKPDFFSELWDVAHNPAIVTVPRKELLLGPMLVWGYRSEVLMQSAVEKIFEGASIEVKDVGIHIGCKVVTKDEEVWFMKLQGGVNAWRSSPGSEGSALFVTREFATFEDASRVCGSVLDHRELLIYRVYYRAGITPECRFTNGARLPLAVYIVTREVRDAKPLSALKQLASGRLGRLATYSRRITNGKAKREACEPCVIGFAKVDIMNRITGARDCHDNNLMIVNFDKKTFLTKQSEIWVVDIDAPEERDCRNAKIVAEFNAGQRGLHPDGMMAKALSRVQKDGGVCAAAIEEKKRIGQIALSELEKALGPSGIESVLREECEGIGQWVDKRRAEIKLDDASFGAMMADLRTYSAAIIENWNRLSAHIKAP
jgi:hypothetical protein